MVSGPMVAVLVTLATVALLIVLVFALLMVSSRVDDEAEAEMEALRCRQKMRDAALKALDREGRDDAS